MNPSVSPLHQDEVFVYVTALDAESVHLVLDDVIFGGDHHPETVCGLPVIHGWHTGDETLSGISSTCDECRSGVLPVDYAVTTHLRGTRWAYTVHQTDEFPFTSTHRFGSAGAARRQGVRDVREVIAIKGDHLKVVR